MVVGRGVRHVRHMPGAGDGRVLEVSGRESEAGSAVQGVCRRLGRVQSQLPSMLHESLDQAEQPMSVVSTRVDRTKTGQIINYTYVYVKYSAFL